MTEHRFSPEPLTRARAKIIAELGRGSARQTHGLFRLEGWRVLKSAADVGVELEEVVVREDTLDESRLAILHQVRTKGIYRIGAKGMSRLTTLLQDQGVIATAQIRLTLLAEAAKGQRMLVLDGIQDPGNVGTLIRSAAWFGIDAVLAGPNTADFFNPKVVRATAGGLWDVSLVHSHDLAADLSELKSHRFTCYCADVEGAETRDWQHHEKVALVLGNEGHGISEHVRKHMDGSLHIPGTSKATRGVESLNVATAGSILIHRWVT